MKGDLQFSEKILHEAIDELSFDTLKTRRPDLDEDQLLSCLIYLQRFYQRLSDYNDVSISDLLFDSWNFARIEGSNLIGPSSDVLVNAALSEQMDRLISKLSQELAYKTQREILKKENFKQANLIGLSNNNIIGLVKSIIEESSSLAQLDFLIELKKHLSQSASLKGYIDFSNEERIIEQERDTQALLEWIENNMLLCIPPIRFQSDKQKLLLKKIIIRASTILNSESIVERFKRLIAHKGLATSDYNENASTDPGEEIKSDAKPHEIINSFYKAIEKFMVVENSEIATRMEIPRNVTTLFRCNVTTKS